MTDESMSQRRRHVLQLRLSGASVAAIAEQLEISTTTVRRDIRTALSGQPLEVERLEQALMRVTTVIGRAAAAGDSETVLAGVDRIVRLSDAQTRATAVRSGRGPLVKAVTAQLKTLHESMRDGPLAHTALMLAGMLDAGMTARDAAATSRELRLTLQAIDDANPSKAEADPVDELGARRERRLTASR